MRIAPFWLDGRSYDMRFMGNVEHRLDSVATGPEILGEKSAKPITKYATAARQISTKRSWTECGRTRRAARMMPLRTDELTLEKLDLPWTYGTKLSPRGESKCSANHCK